MNRVTIFIIIGLSIIIFIFLGSLLKVKRIIKKGKKVKAKVIKKEREECKAASHDDPGIMRHWFNLEVEVNNKIYKRDVAITNYTKDLKVGENIDIILYKEDFLLEDELGEYNKWKN